MPIPESQAGPNQSHAYSTLPKLVTLAGSASNSPTAWEWTMLTVPPGSTANSGANNDFTNGVANIQNPQFTADVDGAFVLQLRAQNATGWSVPNSDEENGQTIIYILTEKFGLEIPGHLQYRYDLDLNETIKILETKGLKLKVTTNDTTENYLDSKIVDGNGLTKTIQNPGANENYKLDVDFGTLANTACEGNDSRLSDSRTPSGAASGQLGGTYPSPDVRGIRTTEGGGTELTIASVSDGQFLKRSGSNVIGSTSTAGPSLNFTATVDPTVDDDVDLGYSQGSIWLNENSGVKFICIDNTDGAAEWIRLSVDTISDDLNDSSIHARMTQDIPTTGTIAEDGNKLSIVDSGGTSLDWFTGNFNAPNVNIDMLPRDFTSYVNVSNISANDYNAGSMILYVNGAKSSNHRFDIGYLAGSYQIRTFYNSGAELTTLVGQNNLWICLMRRGTKIMYYYSTNAVTSEPSIDDFTLFRTVDVAINYNNNRLALAGLIATGNPALDVHFKKFRVIY